MYSRLKIYLVVIFLSIPVFASPALEEDETKNILFICSMNEGIVAYQMILDNFKDLLLEEHTKPYKLFIEYLDVGRFPDLSYQEYLFERFNKKYMGADLDLLIVIGPRVIPIIANYASEYLKNLPTISLDFNYTSDNYDKYSLHSNTTEILATIDAKKNIDLAFKLFPDYSTIYIVSGATTLDNFLNKVTMDAVHELYSSKKIVNIANIPMETVLDRASQIPEKSIIVVTTFTSDANNVNYSTPEAIRLISKKTSAPIFVLLDTPFEEGAFGGYVTSMKMAGFEAGKTAIRILNGENPKSIKIDPDVLNKYVFDWRELKKRGLEDSELIPAGSMILHQEYDFIDTNKWLISGALLFIILQTLLIVNLVQLNRKQKVTTKKLLESENRFRELVREERILQMGELAASLSHELNQPLTAIRNSAQAGLRIMKKNKIDPAIIDEILQNIVDDDKRAAEVLSSIRQLLKLEKREKQKIDLNQMIKQVADIFKGELIIKNIKLQLNLSENLVYVSADSTQIQQVLLNFVSNAAQAMEDVKDDKRVIKIFEEIVNNKVIVSVRDYGTGIDETIKGKLFKPFATTKEKGFGIGLAISKTIIDEHEGKIWADNNSDGGATFSFQLNLWDYDPKG
jgi:signal transduction histidine kinase